MESPKKNGPVGSPRRATFKSENNYWGLTAGSGLLSAAVLGSVGVAGLAVVSLPKRVRYGMNGVTSNGIFSRSATVPTGLLLISSKRSDHGFSPTPPPIGRAALNFGLLFCSGVDATVFRSTIAGTWSPKCALIKLGISCWR